jgi:hypothetical protein
VSPSPSRSPGQAGGTPPPLIAQKPPSIANQLTSYWALAGAAKILRPAPVEIVHVCPRRARFVVYRMNGATNQRGSTRRCAHSNCAAARRSTHRAAERTGASVPRRHGQVEPKSLSRSPRS